jgi:hypothetical protein
MKNKIGRMKRQLVHSPSWKSVNSYRQGGDESIGKMVVRQQEGHGNRGRWGHGGTDVERHSWSSL